MIQTIEHFQDALRAARRVSTPLLAIRTADPASAIQHVVASLNGKHEETPLLNYDFVTGLRGTNDRGRAAASKVLGDALPANVSVTEALVAASLLEQDSILFFHNPQGVWSQPDVLQGIWNLRDPFKNGGQMLVLLTTVGATLPAEIKNDVMVFDEPLPSTEGLKQLVLDTFEQAKLPAPTPALQTKAIDALLGLPLFPAETALSMSLSKKGLDQERLWERKCTAIEQTRGLAVWRGTETFADIGGCDVAKKFITDLLNGQEPPRLNVFVDEIEKAFAGTGTDLSGVKTELTGTILVWLQDHNAQGITFVGPPGTAKSAVGKAAGAVAGIPTIALDFSAMQSGIVGSSGENLRTALQVIDAISQGRTMWIATCNSINSLPPELRRRFQRTFFFDLPTREERKLIWNIYLAKFGIKLKGAYPYLNEMPDDTDWTGAEIKTCCETAWRLRISLREAAQYIVPVARSAADTVEALRRSAEGKFLSASYPGPYARQNRTQAPAKRNLERIGQ